MKNNNKSLPKDVSIPCLTFPKDRSFFTFTCLKNMLKFVNKIGEFTGLKI